MFKEKKKKSSAFELLESIIIAVLLALIIRFFLFEPFFIPSGSMEPTLQIGDKIIVNKIVYRFQEPKRGDIMVFKYPLDPARDYIKRVIGISGDKVQIKDGKVYLNDELLNEDYIEKDAYTMVYNVDTWLVPEGQVFVLGDNRDEGASKDSRYFGCVSLNQVKGITEFRYYPFNEGFGKI